MKRTLSSLAKIFIVAIVLQVAWDQLKSEKNPNSQGFMDKLFEQLTDGIQVDYSPENDWKKDIEEVKMKDVLSQTGDKSGIDIFTALEQMIGQARKVYIPELSNKSEVYSASIAHENDPDEVSIDISYHSDVVDGELAFLRVENENDFKKEYRMEKISKPIELEYKGFTGVIGPDKDYDDTILLFAEKDNFYYDYQTYVEMDKKDWVSFFEQEINRLKKSDTLWKEYLQIDEEQLQEIIYPHFTEDVNKSYMTIDYEEFRGTSLRISYELSPLKEFQYFIYFNPKKLEESLEHVSLETIQTESGHDVFWDNRSKDSSFGIDYYYWYMDGMGFEIMYDEFSEHMDQEEVLLLVDSLIEQQNE